MEYVNLDTLVWFQEGPGVRNYQYVDKGIKLINVTNLVNGQLKLHLTSRYISEEEAFGKYKHFLCDNGDLVIASSGITYETLSKKIAFVTEKDLPLCMNTSVIRFKPINHDVCIDYIYYFFKSEKYRNQISKLMTGSAQLNYGPSHLHKVKIPYYDIVKQTKIADELKKIDENISICYRNIDNLDNIVKSQFIEMFGDLTLNPYGWPIMKISDISKFIKSGLSRKLSDKDIGFPVIRSGNIQNGELIFDDIKYWYKEDPQGAKTDEYILEDSDILVNFINSVSQIGKSAIFRDVGRDCIYTTNIFRMKLNESCNEYYYNWFAMSQYYYSQLENIIKPAVNQASFTTVNFLKLNIPLPPIDLQNKFANFVQQIDKSKFNMKDIIIVMVICLKIYFGQFILYN